MSTERSERRKRERERFSKVTEREDLLCYSFKSRKIFDETSNLFYKKGGASDEKHFSTFFAKTLLKFNIKTFFAIRRFIPPDCEGERTKNDCSSRLHLYLISGNTKSYSRLIFFCKFSLPDLIQVLSLLQTQFRTSSVLIFIQAYHPLACFLRRDRKRKREK